MDDVAMFGEEVQKLAEVKASILKKVGSGPAAPSIVHAANFAIMFLDTAYLWLAVALNSACAQHSEANVEKEVTNASEMGKLLTFPGGAQSSGPTENT